MRKLLLLFLSGLFVTTVIQAQTAVSGVILTPDTLMLYVDGTSVLVAEVLPSGASEKSVTWKSTATDVIEIIESEGASCRIKALKSGKSDVVVTTHEGNFRDTCTVIVVVHAEDVILSDNELNMNIGKDTILVATIYPLADTNDSVKWTSSDPSIVSILSMGYDTICHIEALKIGTCKIYAETVDGGKKDFCEVTVDYVPVTDVNITKDSLIFYRGATSELTAIISPLYGTDDSITWTSTDSSVVDIISISDDTICQIKAEKSGRAVIYAETYDGGYKDSCVVFVHIPVESIALNKNKLTLDVDSTSRLITTILPDSVTDKSLLWSSNDTDILQIDSIVEDTICYVKALKAGSAKIHVMTKDELFKDSCLVTVNPVHVDSIAIYQDSLNLSLEDLFKLTATIFPANSSNDSVVWTSTDSSVVNITSTGYDTICYIEALAYGEAKIYITSVDGGFKDSCVVTVKAIPVTGIKLPEDSLDLFIDNTFDLIALVTPSDASDKSIRWTSSDSSIVNILTDSNDSLCIIRGEALGMATIYAQTFDGEFKDSCVFTVKEQDIFAESDIETVDGLIDLYINIPENAGVAGSFELNLPKGFGLAVGESFAKTALTDEFETISELKVTTKNDSLYLIEIIPDVVPKSKAVGAVSKRKVMSIAYTVYDKELEHSTATYDAKLRNIELILSDDTKIDGEQIDFKIKAYTDETANDNIGEGKIVTVYMSDTRLFVNSSDAEVIYVYSLNGGLLFKGNKTEGQAIFNINTEGKILIIRGSSGWVKKVVNQ